MRTLNVRLAAVLLVVTVFFGVGVYFLHAFQVKRNAYVFLEEADRAEKRAEDAAKNKNFPLAQEEFRNTIKDLSWYVRLMPHATETLERLGLLLSEQSREGDILKSRRMFMQGYGMLERTLRQDPKRKAARRKLVEMAIFAQRYQDAMDHLQDFLLKKSPDDADLLELLGQCQLRTGNYNAALESFEKAIECSPNHFSAYSELAKLLRSRLSRPEDADQWMDKLVAANPDADESYSMRGRYLLSIGMNDEALEDALKALKLAPKKSETLWLAAVCNLAVGKYDEARDCATRGVELFPDEIRLYTTLADIELRSGNRDKAVTALQNGLRVTGRSLQLLWSLANLMIDLDNFDEAKKIIEELQATDYPEQLVNYLVARIDFVQGHWYAALRAFEKDRDLLAMWPGLAKQVDVWVGQCYGKLGNRDKQLQAYRRALIVDPSYAAAKAAETDALMAMGQLNQAVNKFGQLSREKAVTPSGSVVLSRMLLLQALRQDPASRNWKVVEDSLDASEKALPDSPDVTILRAEMLVAQDHADAAEKLVREARDKNPKQVKLWTTLASLAERKADWEKTEKILNEAEQSLGDCVPLRLARSRYLVRRYGKEAIERLQPLAENTKSFSDGERLQLLSGLLNAAVQTNDTQQIKKFSRQIAAREPNDIQIRYFIFEKAFARGDQEAMKEAIDEIERVAGKMGYWSYGQAALLFLQSKDQQDVAPTLNKALKYLAQTREYRKDWARVPLMEAWIYDRLGDPNRALKGYKEAVSLGGRNPSAVRRMIQILFQKKQYAEADRLLRQLEGEQIPFSAELNQASAEVALRQGEYERALEMAEKVVSKESKNPQEQIWLGQVLGIIGSRAQKEGQEKEAQELLGKAEKALRRAVEIDPESPAGWVALIRFFSASKEEDKAEKTIQEASLKLPAEKAPLALAQCYEVVQKADEAEKKYEAALAASPQDINVVRTVADFYQRTGKLVSAEALLRRIIDGKVEALTPDVIWARRQLALIYAARGGYQNLQKARELVEENLAVSGGSLPDQRVKAHLDAADPQRTRRNEAVQTFETMLQEQAASPEDRFALAKMYLAAGDWVKASSQFRSLVATHDKEPRFLIAYIEALLQHHETSNVEMYLDRLLKNYPTAFVTTRLHAELLFAKNEFEKVFELLKNFVDMAGAEPKDRNLRIRLVAEGLSKFSQRLTKPEQEPMAKKYASHAETLYREYVKANPKQALLLAMLLGRQGSIDEALDLLERSLNSNTPRDISRVSAVLLNGRKPDKEQLRRLDRILQSALRRFERPVSLLLAMTELRTQQARYADAESIYREILGKSSGNAVAMNNLAVLLALQGVKLDESLKLVDQAIEIAGPVAAMLDSRASVYIARNELDKALEDLQLALAEQATPVRLFHQAQAYEKAGQSNAASVAMDKAMQKGLTKEMLQPLELPTFEKLQRLLR